MRTVIIENDELKEILLKKKEIVEKGRPLNTEIEEKTMKIVKDFFVKKGVKDAGIEDSIQLFTGNYQQFLDLFSTSGQTELNTVVESELEEELKTLKTYEYQIQKLNEQVLTITNDDKSIELGEYEQTTTISIENDELVVTIVDMLEEWKEKFAEQKKQMNSK